MQEKSQDNDYWRDRFRQMEEAQNRASIEQAQLMAEQYERAERKIAGKINAWYQRFANNNEITMAGIYQIWRREFHKPGVGKGIGKCIRPYTYQKTGSPKPAGTAGDRGAIW